MDLARFMDELAIAAKPVIERVYPYPIDKVSSPPALIVAWPERVDYDGTYQRGMDRFLIPLFIVVGRGGVDRARRNQIASWLSGSLKAAVESGVYTSEPVVNVSSGEIDFVELGGVDYLALRFMVEMSGSGYGTELVRPPFYTTTELRAWLLTQGPDPFTSWMPCNPTVNTRRDPDWELGQYNTTLNDDGSPTNGFMYNNTKVGGVMYDNADWMFIADPELAYSGTGFLRLYQRQQYAEQLGPQAWRTLDQNGNNLPFEHRATWRMRFNEEITYDNSDGAGHFGFTNHFQIYRTSTIPAEKYPLITMGAGRNLQNDTRFRWHFDLSDRSNFDLPRLADPVIPIGSWINCECHWSLTDQGTGYLRFWQDGAQVLNYSGPTTANFFATVGTSWNAYGTLLGQNPTIDFDEVGTFYKTHTMYDKLVLPLPQGGLN